VICGSGRHLGKVAAAAPLFVQRHPAAVRLGGSPIGVRGKIVSWRTGDAPSPVDRARKVLQ
jgi:hypothetical protein